MHFADQTLWLAMSCILACFDLKPFIDEAGAAILPEVAFDGGVFRYLSCRALFLSPRFDGAFSQTP